MPVEIVLSGGGSVKVIASLDQVTKVIRDRASSLETARFAGFRGDEAVSGEPIVISVAAIGYAQQISTP